MTDDKPRIKEIRQSEDRFLASDVFEERNRVFPGRNGSGTWREEARDLDIYHQCDVLVVGGGPSGTAAALAAARTGADVVVLERYNHLGGLSTGGTVSARMPEGKVSLRIPAWTNSGKVFRIPGRGLPKKGGMGDLKLTTVIMLPDEPDPALVDLLKAKNPI